MLHLSLCVKQHLMREVGYRQNVWYVASVKEAIKHNMLIVYLLNLKANSTICAYDINSL